MEKRRTFLDDDRTSQIDLLHYSYKIFKEYYPDKLKKYEIEFLPAMFRELQRSRIIRSL